MPESSRNTDACRTGLSELDPREAQNPGLALHRYLRRHDGEHSGTRELLDGVTAATVSSAYAAAFQRWEALQKARDNLVVWEETLLTPMAVGLGSASPLEIGRLDLDRP